MSSWSQLFFLILFTFIGFILAVSITLIVKGNAVGQLQSIDLVRIMQLVQAVCLFLLPACICAVLFHSKPFEYLRINTLPDFKFLFFSILLIIAIQPLISFTGYCNSLLTLPESLAPLERWMKEMEGSTKLLMERLLTTDSVSVFLLNIFVIAIMAGITEEFFFRGTMQQIFKKIFGNPHVTVWVTAFIFSFIHFQFYGFVPRLLLGAVLGYLFLWSQNLWIPIIVHAINNLMSLLIFHFYHGTPVYDELEIVGTGNTFWMAIVSTVISGGILFLLSKEYIKNNPEEFSV